MVIREPLEPARRRRPAAGRDQHQRAGPVGLRHVDALAGGHPPRENGQLGLPRIRVQELQAGQRLPPGQPRALLAGRRRDDQRRVTFGSDLNRGRHAAIRLREPPVAKCRRHLFPDVIPIAVRQRIVLQRRDLEAVARDRKVRALGGHLRRRRERRQLQIFRAAKIGDAVEREVVGIVVIVRPAQAVVVRGARHGHKIVAVELPVRVLESMLHRVGMVSHDGTHLPISQVGRADQGQRVPRGGGLAALVQVPLRDPIGQRPVVLRHGIETDREFGAAARQIDEARFRIERRRPAVVADRDDGRLAAAGRPVHAEHIDDAAFGRSHRIALEPAAEFSVQPLRVPSHAVAARPTVGLQQIGFDRGRHHERAKAQPPDQTVPPVFHRPPDAAVVDQYGLRGAVVLAVFQQQARVPILWDGPSPAAVVGAADDGVPILLAGAHQVQGVLVNEQRGPERAVDRRLACPGLPAIR